MSFGLLAAYVTPQAADILCGATPSDPKGIHDAWMELNAAQQAGILKGDPARFGNLNGIPAKDRDTANRFVLQDQLDRVKAAMKTLKMDPTMDPEVLEGMGVFSSQVWAKVSGMSRDQAAHALRVYKQLHPGKDIKADSVHLLAYEPGADDGNGRAAIGYGDVDGADNVAFCVPGLNSTLGNFQNVSSDARHLFKAAAKAAPSRHTAVVAWQGYDAPNYREVGSPNHAEIGAKLLAAAVNTTRITHDGPIKGKLTAQVRVVIGLTRLRGGSGLRSPFAVIDAMERPTVMQCRGTPSSVRPRVRWLNGPTCTPQRRGTGQLRTKA